MSIRHRNYIDSTKNRLNQGAVKGSVSYAESIIHNGEELRVDGKKVLFEVSKEEKTTAILLAESLGGNVEIQPRVNSPEGVRTPDYKWNNFRIDRKGPTGNGMQTIFHQIQEIKGQANCLALDTTKTNLKNERIRSDLEKAFGYKSCKHLDMVIVIKDNRIIYILERKKRGFCQPPRTFGGTGPR